MEEKKDLVFKSRFLFCIVLCLGLLLAVSSSPSLAQSDEDGFILEEIIVTAEKREASLQRVPLAIDVIRPDDMDTRGVFDTQDLGKILPDLQINMAAGNYMQINLREVPDLIFNPEFETSVSLHMDGVQLTRNQGFNNYFFDLERVEVLKGPVGSLYGRGSTAGAINIISQKPVLGEFGGNLSVEFGNYNERRYMAAINIPVTDKLAFRLAGRIYEHDGYTDVGYNDANGYGARIGVTWEPTEKDIVTGTVDFQGYDNEGAGSTGVYLDVFGNLSVVPNTTTNPSNLSGTTIPDTYDFHPISIPYKMKWFTGPNYLDKNGGTAPFPTARPRPYDNYNDDDSWGVTLQWEHDFSFGYLTTLYGHRELEELKDWVYNGVSFTSASQDADGISREVRLNHFALGNTLFVGNGTESHFDSLESHLTSKSTIDAGDRAMWVVGGIIQDDNIMKYADPSFNVYWEDLQTLTKALYGQATVKIIEGLNFTGGYRHSWDKKKYYGTSYGTFGLIDFDNPDNPRHHEEYDMSEDTYKAGLSWQMTDDAMLYGGYSRGYKTGNVQNDGSFLPPEFLNAWNIGIKSQLFGNRLQVNLDAYHYEYENFNQWTQANKCSNYRVYAAPGSTTQTGIYTPGPSNGPDATAQNVDLTADNGLALIHVCSGLENPDGSGTFLAVGMDDYDINDQIAVAAGGSKQKGISGDIMFLITPNDTVKATVRWSKNEWDNYNLANAILARYPLADNVYSDPATYGDTSGVEFGGAPIKGNITYSHTQYIGMDVLSFNTTAYYEGTGVDQRMYNARDDFFYMPGADAYWLMDASLSYRSSRWVPEDMSWQVRLWGTNIFDSQELRSIGYATSTTYDVRSGTISGQFVDPMTYGVTFSINF